MMSEVLVERNLRRTRRRNSRGEIPWQSKELVGPVII
jgi:hypothetical protein